MKFKVLGSKKFLDMPIGTFYSRLSIECKISLELQILYIVEKIKAGHGYFSMYIDNECALDFGDEERNYKVDDILDPENHYIIDRNVVGDADPTDTLYLIIPENTIPDEVDFDCIHLTKDEILKIRKNLIKSIPKNYRDNSKNPNNDWARRALEENYYKNNPTVNFNEEIEVDI